MNKQIRNSSPPAGTPSERPRPSSEGKPQSYTAGGKDCFVGQQDAGLREHDLGNENGLGLSKSLDVRELRSGRKSDRVPGRTDKEARVSLTSLSVGRDALMVLPGPSRKDATSDGEDTEGSVVSMRSVASAGSGVSRAAKRARLPGPATNGGSPKSKRKPRPRQKPEIEIDDNDPYLSSVSVSSTRSKDTLPRVEDLASEMREQPVADLGARILESMETVTKVADHSKNLKGNFVRSLRLAAITAKAAADEMAQRTASIGSEGWLERENANLRSKLSGVEDRLKTLQAEMELLRQRERAPPRKEDRRQPARGADEILMDRIGALVENKLAAFKAELLPGRAIRPPLGKRLVTSDAPAAALPPPPPPKPRRGSDEILMDRVGALIERKLADFKAELYPDRVRRPNQEPAPVAPVVAPATAAPKKKKKKKAKKGGKKGANLQPPPVPKGAPAVTATVAGPSGLQTRSWAQVAGKKPASRPSERAAASKPKPAKPQKPAQQASSVRAKPARPPNTAVVAVTVPEGADTTYAAVMGAAKQRVSLAECGISDLRQKRAATGGLILEVPGPDSARKADDLAARLRSALTDMNVRISRPVKTGEIRVTDFDESVTQADIASAIADQGGCSREDVKVGEIRLSPRMMGTAWVKCPLIAIRKLAGTARLRVGWASARVQVLTARPLQCFKCLEMGHVRSQCPNAEDRSSCCYKCGLTGHKTGSCQAREPKCPVCTDLGRPSNHRLGSQQCTPPKRRKGRGQQQNPQPSRDVAPSSRQGESPPEAMEAQDSLP
ncbi:caskin-1-like [Pectinophora gossypiella]|uniref:caskin-1-like n=1 Tax=Pectinophora gossypiella TaxID=13191 RepID=UPI00214E1227|nr:caskin-1-like [Pectinophora gossypiella]